jgi:hypothetical protein
MRNNDIKKISVLCLFLLSSISSFAQDISTNKYFRHLRYNHVSPYISLAGTYPIDSLTASNTSHYIFKYNESNQPIEIINNHYHTEKVHPLASIGAYRTVIEYQKRKEIRTFYDMNDKRILNDRAVYKEVHLFDKRGFKKGLKFYDLEDKPMQSNWDLTEYVWVKDKEFIIERRFNLENKPVDVSPYFPFGITKIVLTKDGVPKAHYNLNEKLEVTNNVHGIASYQDIYDAMNNHTQYSYHDKSDSLVQNQWGFALGKKVYDSIGNNIRIDYFDANNTSTRSRDLYSNVSKKLSPIASKKDSVEIIKQSSGYLVALQELSPKLMNEVLNDSLNKVTVGYDRERKAEYARATTREQMIEFATSWNKANNKFPTRPSNQIEILDIYNRIANVKITSDNWVEYLHLIKLDDKWTIINLIWQHKDVNRYPD